MGNVSLAKFVACTPLKDDKVPKILPKTKCGEFRAPSVKTCTKEPEKKKLCTSWKLIIWTQHEEKALFDHMTI